MNKILATTALLSLAILGACSPVRKSNFECPHPQGVSCISATEVYDRLENGGFQQIRTTEPSGNTGGVGHTVRIAGEELLLSDRGQPLNESHTLRTEPQVLRVHIAAYEGDKGDLHGGQYIDTEITPRRWAVGAPNSDVSTSNVISPLGNLDDQRADVGRGEPVLEPLGHNKE